MAKKEQPCLVFLHGGNHAALEGGEVLHYEPPMHLHLSHAVYQVLSLSGQATISAEFGPVIGRARISGSSRRYRLNSHACVLHVAQHVESGVILCQPRVKEVLATQKKCDEQPLSSRITACMLLAIARSIGSRPTALRKELQGCCCSCSFQRSRGGAPPQ